MNKLIIADDHPLQQLTLNDYITNYFAEKQIPVHLDIVSNGSDLVKAVLADHYSAVISDNSMPPGISGIEAIKKIRPAKPDILIYLHSATADQGQALSCGANGYIEKGNLDSLDRALGMMTLAFHK